jgi:hypothetical protein
MEIIEGILTRQSIRKYTNKEISDEQQETPDSPDSYRDKPKRIHYNTW